MFRPPRGETKGAGDQVGIQAKILGDCHELRKVASLEWFTSREVKLQDAESPRLGHHPLPIRRGQLLAVVRKVERVGAVRTVKRAGVGQLRQTTSILLEEVQQVIQAAMQKAEEIGQPMNVAVVDNGRDLKAFARMEDAWLGSIDIAINKAFSSASFQMPTGDLTEMTQPGQPLYGLEATNNGRVVIFAGGIVLMRGDEIAGAIGVSGGTVDQDQELAEAGVAAF